MIKPDSRIFNYTYYKGKIICCLIYLPKLSRKAIYPSYSWRPDKTVMKKKLKMSGAKIKFYRQKMKIEQSREWRKGGGWQKYFFLMKYNTLIASLRIFLKLIV